jgi:hypothetical protein
MRRGKILIDVRLQLGQLFLMSLSKEANYKDTIDGSVARRRDLVFTHVQFCSRYVPYVTRREERTESG